MIFLAFQVRAILSICVCTSILKFEFAWQKHTGDSKNSVSYISKFDLNPNTIVDTMIKKNKSWGLEASCLTEEYHLSVLF